MHDGVGSREDDLPLFPKTVALELSSVCRLSCRYCDKRNWKEQHVGRRRPFLDAGLFRSVLEELAERWPRPDLTLSFEGESTLHPEFPRLLAFAAELGFRPWISTSLVGTDEASLEAMAEHAGVVSVSLDGLEQGFARCRGNQYPQVVESFKRLLTYRKARSCGTRLSVSMVTHEAHRIGPDARAFLEKWLPEVDEAHLFEEYVCGAGIRVHPSTGLERHLARRRRCHQPFSYLAVLSDGRLCPCCTTSRVTLPTLHAGGGLDAAIKSADYRDFLDRHGRCELGGTACATCDGWIEGWLAGEDSTVVVGEISAKTQSDGLGLHVVGIPRSDAGVRPRAPLPPLGLGTRVGWGDEVPRDAGKSEASESPAAVLETALCAGVTLFDTSPDYGAGRAQSLLGAALAEAMARGLTTRDELFLIGRVGRLPARSSVRPHAAERFEWPELCEPEDVLPGRRCFAPRWLRESMRRSLLDLRSPRLDLVLLQEPEWLLSNGETNRRDALRRVFTVLEEERSSGKIDAYGISSHVGLLSGPDHPMHLELDDCLAAARDIAGANHGLRAVAVPLNLETMAAAVSPSQNRSGRRLSLLAAVDEAGLDLIAGAPLGRGRLVRSLPSGEIHESGRTYTPTQWLIQFIRSLPGVQCAVFGTTNCAHLIENMAAVSDPPWSANVLRGIAS